MKIIVCVKEVADPDAINAFALGGQLKIVPTTKTVQAEGIPSLMNAYDEQAIEAALRLRDAGVKSEIKVLSMGCKKPQQLFSRAFALGADEGYLLQDPALDNLDGPATAYALACAIKHLGGADLILCGRQASDDDQGVVGLGLATILGMPCVTMARAVKVPSEGTLRVTRVLPDGEEEIEAVLPTVVTISNELGDPRYPKASDLMAARRKKATTLTAKDVGIDLAKTAVQTRRVDLRIPEVQGKCEFIQGENTRALAAALAKRLRAERLV